MSKPTLKLFVDGMQIATKRLKSQSRRNVLARAMEMKQDVVNRFELKDYKIYIDIPSKLNEHANSLERNFV